MNRAVPRKKAAKPAKPLSAKTIRAIEAKLAEQNPLLNEPDKAQRRAAFLVVIALILVLGAAGAAMELFLKPLLAQPLPPPTPAAQEVRMMVTPTGYEPAVATVSAGRLVRWTLTLSPQALNDTTGCSRTIVAPDLQLRQYLTANETIIEFVPLEAGKIPFSCASTEIQGYFTVTAAE